MKLFYGILIIDLKVLKSFIQGLPRASSDAIRK